MPSGLYEQHLGIIERVVLSKRNQYKFPGTSSEDLSQDIRIICFDAINRFDIKRVKNDSVEKPLFSFLARCVDNALYNKFRGIFLNNNPPCIRCEHYIKKTKECAINEEGCDRIIKYRNNMARKRNIFAPGQFAHEAYEPEIGAQADSVLDFLKERLPRRLYTKLIKGEPLTKKEREKIKRYIGRDEIF